MYIGVVYISCVAFINVKQTMYFLKLANLDKLGLIRKKTNKDKLCFKSFAVIYILKMLYFIRLINECTYYVLNILHKVCQKKLKIFQTHIALPNMHATIIIRISF